MVLPRRRQVVGFIAGVGVRALVEQSQGFVRVVGGDGGDELPVALEMLEFSLQPDRKPVRAALIAVGAFLARRPSIVTR